MPGGVGEREAQIIRTAREVAGAGFNTPGGGDVGHQNATWKLGKMPPMIKYVKTPKLLRWPKRKGTKRPRTGGRE